MSLSTHTTLTGSIWAVKMLTWRPSGSYIYAQGGIGLGDGKVLFCVDSSDDRQPYEASRTPEQADCHKRPDRSSHRFYILSFPLPKILFYPISPTSACWSRNRSSTYSLRTLVLIHTKSTFFLARDGNLEIWYVIEKSNTLTVAVNSPFCPREDWPSASPVAYRPLQGASPSYSWASWCPQLSPPGA